MRISDWSSDVCSSDLLDERALQLIDEALPSTTHEVLPDWERIAGLPDECTGPSETIEGRRLRLIQQLAEHGGQSRAFFLSAAASLGYPGCTITEFRPDRKRVGKGKIVSVPVELG